MNKSDSKNSAKYIKLEEILTEKKLITEESILKNIVQNEKIKQLGKIVLATAFISGIIVLSAVAPNIIGVIGKFSKSSGKNKKLTDKKEQKLKKTIYNLRNRKLIEWDQRGDKIMLKITPEGRSFFLKKYFRDLKIEKQATWDKLWRVVLFDIPNSRGKQRDIFRQQLKRLGFFQFQKSAFIIPFPCRAELEATLDYYRLFDYVTYLEANFVSGEEKCRKYFDLKS